MIQLLGSRSSLRGGCLFGLGLFGSGWGGLDWLAIASVIATPLRHDLLLCGFRSSAFGSGSSFSGFSSLPWLSLSRGLLAVYSSSESSNEQGSLRVSTNQATTTLEVNARSQRLRRHDHSVRERHFFGSGTLLRLTHCELDFLALLQDRALRETVLGINLSPVNKVVNGSLTDSGDKAVTLMFTPRTGYLTFLESYHFTVPAIRGLSAEIPSQSGNTVRSVDIAEMGIARG